ncbi:MAG: N-acetylmuramoyl-L-alanine amidase [Candidatus Margulisbacteria bacterium]|nr:N-acetylmuramoyl-L-alanine amidase [Candidatus Margulisiibacteriota bacterium]
MTLFFLIVSPVKADQAAITNIEAIRDRGIDYLDIYTSGWSEAKGLLLERTLYIDFPGTIKSSNIIISKGKSKRISSFNVIQKDRNTARLVINLKKNIDYDIINVFGRNKTVIEIYDRSDSVYNEQYSWEAKNTKPKFARLKPVKLSPVLPAKTTIYKPDRRPLAGKTIILDPGHGGDDPGATACNGIQEKYLTLSTARRTAKLLREAGGTVYLTRNEDRRSSLSEVAAFANKTKADIFISIHYNSTIDSGIKGTESYYYNPVSRRFAGIMHEALVQNLGRKDRGLRRVRFFIVKYSNIPAVLLEPCYLSNASEANLARSADFEDKVAGSILKGVEIYFRNIPR